MTRGDDFPGLSEAQADSYLEVLIAHGSVFGASYCTRCGVAYCPDWVDAYDRLTAARVPIEPS